MTSKRTVRWTASNGKEITVGLTGPHDLRAVDLSAYEGDISHPWGRSQIGLRVTNPRYSDYDSKVGDVLGRSSVWDDGNITDELLPGTSAVDPARLARENPGYYNGRRVLVLAADDAIGGSDPAETIMKDPRVIGILDL